MWSTILDNIAVANVMLTCSEFSENDDYRHDYSFKQYLYALVLWDAIYVPGLNALRGVFRSGGVLYESQDHFPQTIKDTLCDYELPLEKDDLQFIVSQIHRKTNIPSNVDLTADAALLYIVLGQVANMNTILSQKYVEFLRSSGILNKLWSRECILEYVDQEVFEIYKNIRSFFGQDIVHVQTPLLVDYICKNATCARDAINIALQLRETKEMIQFRETMNRIDNAFNNGDLLLINSIEQELTHIINQFIQKEIHTEKANLSFSFTPSFTFPSLTAEFGFPIGRDRKCRHQINLNFITNLVQHGLTKTYRNELNTWTY